MGEINIETEKSKKKLQILSRNMFKNTIDHVFEERNNFSSQNLSRIGEVTLYIDISGTVRMMLYG